MTLGFSAPLVQHFDRHNLGVESVCVSGNLRRFHRHPPRPVLAETLRRRVVSAKHRREIAARGPVWAWPVFLLTSSFTSWSRSNLIGAGRAHLRARVFLLRLGRQPFLREAGGRRDYNGGLAPGGGALLPRTEITALARQVSRSAARSWRVIRASAFGYSSSVASGQPKFQARNRSTAT
jgi:hypothetical protein